MKKIVTLGDELLRVKSQALENFDDQTAKLIGEMFKSMKKYRGIGLAAVQIGVLTRLFVVNIEGDQPRVFINPEILETSLEQEPYEEGCLSIPGINSDVTRPSAVKIQAWNEKARPFTLSADGLLARVIQHEYDHLEGKLFIDRVGTAKKQELVELYNSRHNLV